MKCERCGISCMDAEDYCDHLPCPGSVKERQAARISTLEAERDKAVELLRTECLCYEFSAACTRCKQKHAFLANIGGRLNDYTDAHSSKATHCLSIVPESPPAHSSVAS